MPSEIRPSQIASLLDKVRRNNYHKYLKTVKLNKIRGFEDAQVNFDFPVTALIGPNGGGKSTVLGAAACAYKDIKPGLFFPKSSIGDNSMSEWSIEYELLDRDINRTNTIRRSSKFHRLKWVRGDVVRREVRYFGIKRTVPAGERPEFHKLMRPTYTHPQPLNSLPQEAATEIERILGRNVHEFKRTVFTANETFHVGNNKGTEYSEFHFGAGESSIIRIVTEIESLPESSIVLIEEIENGLHPVATRRLVEYLIAAAERKRIQAIFTTHSDNALTVLPPEAVWSCFDGKTQQGKLRIETLRAISGKIDTAVVVFTEDDFAKFVVESIIREFITDKYDQIKVYALAGDGTAVKVYKNRLEDPTIVNKSLCVIDGDSSQTDDSATGIYRLPGRQPESTIFSDVMSKLSSNLAILTVSLQLPPDKQEFVSRTINSVATINRDPHLLFNQIGMQLGFVPEDIVKGAFVNQWIRDHASDLQPIIDIIKSKIDEDVTDN